MTKHDSKARPQPAFLFDLDGTLIDSVYQHVLAWREALEAEDIHLPSWYIHRRIGMSGGLIIHAFFREAGRQLDRKEIARLQKLHTEAFMKRVETVRVLPGARDLLETLSRLGVCWASVKTCRLSQETMCSAQNLILIYFLLPHASWAPPWKIV